jgi:hypothetical protein
LTKKYVSFELSLTGGKRDLLDYTQQVFTIMTRIKKAKLCVILFCIVRAVAYLSATEQPPTPKVVKTIVKKRVLKVQLDKDSDAVIDRIVAELEIMTAKVSGCTEAAAVFSAAEDCAAQLKALKNIQNLNEFRKSSIKLSATFCSLGLAVAVHPELQSFRYHFWEAMKATAALLGWSEQVDEELFNEMVWAEFYAGKMKKVLVATAAASAIFSWIANGDKVRVVLFGDRKIFPVNIPSSSPELDKKNVSDNV